MSGENKHNEQMQDSATDLFASWDVQEILECQRQCFEKGQPFASERFLSEHPALADNANAALEIILNEKNLREKAGEPLLLEELLIRFPQYAGQLQSKLNDERTNDQEDSAATSVRTSIHAGSEDSTDSINTVVSQTSDIEPGDAIGHDGSRYRILRSHARGGLGEVFVAVDEELGREVALKEIQARHGKDPECQARFVLEAEITGRLEHPGIVPVYGLNAYKDGRPYYAMRFIQGESLKQAIQRYHSAEEKGEPAERPIELRRLLKHFQDSCHAIAHAHSRGVIHRDIKPANIMVGECGETLVVDWGLAKEIENQEESSSSKLSPSKLKAASDLTETGSILGTPGYMSPEQASPDCTDLESTSDVFGLGATLYNLLTGQAPFKAKDFYSLVKKNIAGEFTPPRQVNPTVPAPLDAICCKAMAFKPEDRYQTATELSNDIDRWLADEPVHAYKEPFRVRFTRWRRRHRTLVTSLYVFVFALLLATVVGTWMISVEQSKTAEAQTKLNLQQSKTLKEQQARLEEQQAKGKALRRAEKISNYLFSVLRSPDPTKNVKAHDVRVGEVLDDAVRKVETDFKDDPQTRADILEELASTWYNLGLPVKAVTLYDRTRNIRKVTLGADHPETLESMRLLGRALNYAGLSQKAIPLLEDCLQRMQKNKQLSRGTILAASNDLASAYRTGRRVAQANALLEKSLQEHQKHFGATHQATLNTLALLAQSTMDAGRPKTALHLAKEAYDKLQTKSALTDPDTLFAMLVLAECHAGNKDYEKAVALLQKNLHLRQSQLGSSHRDTVTTMNCLGRVYGKMSNYSRAIPLLENAGAIRVSDLGSDHPETMASLRDLGQTYHLAGQSGKAIPLLQSVLRWEKATQEKGQPEIVPTMVLLAEAHHRTGDYKAAIPLYQDSLKLAGKFGESELDIDKVRTNLLETYHATSRFDDARKILAEMLKDARSEFPAGSKELADRISLVAWNLLKARKYSEAEPLCRESVSIHKQLYSEPWLFFRAQSMLGESLTGQKKFPEAEPLLLEGYKGLSENAKSIPAEEPPHLTMAAQRLVHLYEAWDKTDQAQLWQKTLEAKITASARIIRDFLTKKQLKKTHTVRLEAGRIYEFEHRSLPNTYVTIEDPRQGKAWRLFNNAAYLFPGQQAKIYTYWIAPRTDDFRLSVSGGKFNAEGTYMFALQELVPQKTLFTHQGELTHQDKVSQDRIYRDHSVQLSAGVPYVVELTSSTMDPFLFLLNEAGTRDLAANNDIESGRNKNSRLFFTPNVTAKYRIRATTYPQKQTGTYQVTIRPLQKRKPGPEALARLADGYAHAGWYNLAIPLLEQVLDYRQSQLGPTHADTLRIRRDLAHAYTYIERPGEAVPHLEEIYRQAQKQPGGNGNDLFVATVNLGCMYWVTGHYKKSLSMFEQASELNPKAFPADIPGIICALDETLAPPDDDALKQANKLLAIIGNKINRDQLFSGTIVSCSALMSVQSGSNYPMNSVVRVLGNRFDRYHVRMLIANRNLAISSQRLGDYKRASGALRAIQRIERDLYGSRDPRYLATCLDLAEVVLQQEHAADAEGLGRECQLICEKYLPNHWLQFRAKSIRGKCLTLQKKYDQAENFLLAGYEGLKSHRESLPASQPDLLAKAANRLVHHYEARGQREKANHWRKAMK